MALNASLSWNENYTREHKIYPSRRQWAFSDGEQGWGWLRCREWERGQRSHHPHRESLTGTGHWGRDDATHCHTPAGRRVQGVNKKPKKMYVGKSVAKEGLRYLFHFAEKCVFRLLSLTEKVRSFQDKSDSLRGLSGKDLHNIRKACRCNIIFKYCNDINDCEKHSSFLFIHDNAHRTFPVLQ